MSKIFQWFKRRFKELDLLEKYFPLLFTRWQAALWGGSVLAVAFGWHFITADWPYPVKVSACVTALFFAGYYLWRADHIRLVPKLKADSVHAQETPTNFETVRAIFIQVELRCLTEVAVHECRGHLVRVYKKYMDQDRWEPTEMNESLYLGWSHRGHEPVTLEPGAEPRLNICHWASNSKQIIPATNPVPLRAAHVFNSTGTFLFEVRITSKDCAPTDLWVSVSLDNRAWNQPLIELILGGPNGGRSAA
jgi:hypothetical protein